MKESLIYSISTFWTCITLCVLIRYLNISFQKYLKYKIISKKGYPPNHCDVFGDAIDYYEQTNEAHFI